LDPGAARPRRRNEALAEYRRRIRSTIPLWFGRFRQG
jgi:hypothetical protein